MFRLWQQTRGTMGPYSVGFLPEAGGVMDQHAPTMEGLAVISEAYAWLDERFPREPKLKKRTKAG